MEQNHILIIGASAIVIIVVLTVTLYFYVGNGTNKDIYEMRYPAQQTAQNESTEDESAREYIAINEQN